MRIYNHAEQVQIIESLQKENILLRSVISGLKREINLTLRNTINDVETINNLVQQRNDLLQCLKEHNPEL